jgi:hypothetical protein
MMLDQQNTYLIVCLQQWYAKAVSEEDGGFFYYRKGLIVIDKWPSLLYLSV